jgi:hypothetical protein
MYNTALLITPVAAGYVFDKTESYELVLIPGAFLFFLASIVFFFLQAPTRTNAIPPVKT